MASPKGDSAVSMCTAPHSPTPCLKRHRPWENRESYRDHATDMRTRNDGIYRNRGESLNSLDEKRLLDSTPVHAI